jgi:hypothetical protein
VHHHVVDRDDVVRHHLRGGSGCGRVSSLTPLQEKNKNLVVSTQHISVMNDEQEIKFHSQKSSRGLGGDCDDEMRW